MTNSLNNPDFAAIAREADAEILIAESVEATETGDCALNAAELGYYEAELGSLRDAATARLEEFERPTG
jgi:hypothetical protein